MFPEAWPGALCDHLVERWGELREVKRLSRIGGPGAYKVSLAGGQVVVKGGQPEGAVYLAAAPLLRQWGVPVPKAYWTDGYWTAMEWVPAPLPRERWVADPAVTGALVRLHGHSRGQGLPVANPYRAQWTSEMTEGALSCVHPAAATVTATALRSLQEQCQPLFEPVCWISGDPNPTNWGVRADGSPVLFDWERMGLGAPALDLSIARPGVVTDTGEKERRVVACYLEQWRRLFGEVPYRPEVLVKQIRVAKVWTAVELLDNHARGQLPTGARATVEWVAQQLPHISRMVAAD